MPPSVDLYGAAYGNFGASAIEEVRKETYGEDFGQSGWVTGDEYRRFFQLLGLRAGEHVLDVGCGSGGPALFLARETGCRVTGVDISEPGIEAGQALARQSSMQDAVTFRRADVCEPLEFAEGEFDALVCMDVLCHLANRGDLFQDWHRVLPGRPTGSDRPGCRHRACRKGRTCFAQLHGPFPVLSSRPERAAASRGWF